MIHLFKKVYLDRGCRFGERDCEQHFLTRYSYPYRYPGIPGRFRWLEIESDTFKEAFDMSISQWLDHMTQVDKKVIVYLDDIDLQSVLITHYRSLFPGISNESVYHLLSIIDMEDKPLSHSSSTEPGPYGLAPEHTPTRDDVIFNDEPIVADYLEKIGIENISTELLTINYLRNPDKWRELYHGKIMIFAKDTLLRIQVRLYRSLVKLGLRLGLGIDGRMWHPDEYRQNVLSNPLISWISKTESEVLAGDVYEQLTPDLVKRIMMEVYYPAHLFYAREHLENRVMVVREREDGGRDYHLEDPEVLSADGIEDVVKDPHHCHHTFRLGNGVRCQRDPSVYFYNENATYIVLYEALYNGDAQKVADIQTLRGNHVVESVKWSLNDNLGIALFKLALEESTLIDEMML